MCLGCRAEARHSTSPIFFTASINLALSASTNFANPGASS
jgi:hypothetical protein